MLVQVLVDMRDWGGGDEPPAAYVAEEWLSAPSLEDANATWLEAHGKDELQHPFAYVLFLGTDARGDMIPCRSVVLASTWRPLPPRSPPPNAKRQVSHVMLKTVLLTQGFIARLSRNNDQKESVFST